MREKYLPIGSVVLLKGAKKELMITGYLVIEDGKDNKTYDYCGCLYPEGMISSDQTALFDHDQIEKIVYIGYEGPQFNSLLETLKEIENEE